jgi:hypothetical protein
MNRWIATALLASATFANAQTAAPSTPAAATSAAKKELIAKLINLQQAGVDDLAKTITQGPIVNLGQQAGAALQTVPADKRDAAAKSIDADLKKFLAESAPIIQERTTKLAPVVLTPILEEKLTEEELKQIIAWIESPVRKKYESLSPEMRNGLGQRVLADLSPSLNPKLQALQDKIIATLKASGAKLPPKPTAPAASGAKPVAKAASK